MNRAGRSLLVSLVISSFLICHSNDIVTDWTRRIKEVEMNLVSFSPTSSKLQNRERVITPNDKNVKLFFIHIPKCGGTTLRHALHHAALSWNLTSFLPCHPITKSPSLLENAPPHQKVPDPFFLPCETSCMKGNCEAKPWWPQWREHIKNSSIVGGHFSTHFSNAIEQTYSHSSSSSSSSRYQAMQPSPQHFSYVVLFRNPTGRFISHYYHFIQLRARELVKKLESVKNTKSDMVLTHQDRIVAGWYLKPLHRVVGAKEDMAVLLNITIDPKRSLYIEYLGGYNQVETDTTETAQIEALKRARLVLKQQDVTVCLTDLWRDSVEVLTNRYPWLGPSLTITRAKNVRDDKNGSIDTEGVEIDDEREIKRLKILAVRKRRRERLQKMKEKAEAEALQQKENDNMEQSKASNSSNASMIISDKMSGMQTGRRLLREDASEIKDEHPSNNSPFLAMRHHEHVHLLPRSFRHQLLDVLKYDMVLYVESLAKFSDQILYDNRNSDVDYSSNTVMYDQISEGVIDSKEKEGKSVIHQQVLSDSLKNTSSSSSLHRLERLVYEVVQLGNSLL